MTRRKYYIAAPVRRADPKLSTPYQLSKYDAEAFTTRNLTKLLRAARGQEQSLPRRNATCNQCKFPDLDWLLSKEVRLHTTACKELASMPQGLQTIFSIYVSLRAHWRSDLFGGAGSLSIIPLVG